RPRGAGRGAAGAGAARLPRPGAPRPGGARARRDRHAHRRPARARPAEGGLSVLRTVTVAGERFAVRDEGRGPPVLLVHGFPLDHGMWDAQVAALAPRQRVLAPDLRGFGRSVVTDGSVPMARMADDLAALLDALDVREPVVYVGFSMGGYVGWPFVERH